MRARAVIALLALTAPLATTAAQSAGFELNQGQWPASAHLVARLGEAIVACEVDRIRVMAPPAGAAPLDVPLILAGGSGLPRPDRQLPGIVSYILPGAPGTLRGLPTFASVRYPDVAPGADLVVTAVRGGIELDLEVAPHAPPPVLRLEVPARCRLGEGGRVVIECAGRELTLLPPVAWEETDCGLELVTCSVCIEHDDRDPEISRIEYRLETAPRAHPMVLDPVLDLSNCIGGSSVDSAAAMGLDAAGNIYLAGLTISTDFPGVGALYPARAGGNDAFVCMLDPTGTTLLYSTYIGGSFDDQINAIAVEPGGAVVVTGQTKSADYPLTAGAFQTAHAGFEDVFVTRIAPGGTALTYSTLLGGNSWDRAFAAALDSLGNVWISGGTTSTTFPVIAALQPTSAGSWDVLLSCLDPTGAVLVSTYWGGNSVDIAYDLAIDATDGVWVAGATGSTNLPTASPVQASSGGIDDAFLAGFTPGAGALSFGTYLGGGFSDGAFGLALDPTSGLVAISGVTMSASFPVAGAFQPAPGGMQDGFIALLDPLAPAIVWSSFAGGTQDDGISALTFAPGGDLHAAGFTSSPSFPVLDSLQACASIGSSTEIVLMRVGSGGALRSSSCLGGMGSEGASEIAWTPTGLLLAGSTTSADMPVRASSKPCSPFSDALLVRVQAGLHVVDVMASPSLVLRGQTGLQLQVSVENESTRLLQSVVVTPTFTSIAGVDLGPEYSVTPAPGNPGTLAPGVNAIFDFTVDISPTATLGDVILDAGAEAFDPIAGGLTVDSRADSPDLWTVVTCPRGVCGDCDGDGRITILDALLAAQHATGLVALAGAAFSACNVEGAVEPDPAASVSVLDALQIAKLAAGLPASLSCC